MHDTTTTDQSQIAPAPHRPSLITQALCTAATAKCLWIMWVIFTSNSTSTLSRSEIGHIFCAAAIAFPALYVLARDLMGAPTGRHAVGAFRCGMAIGRLRRR